MMNMFRFSVATFAVAIAAIAALQGSVANAQHFNSVDEAYNPGEERGSFELIMKPYPIPAETTTYVDFYFNLPDELPDLFHLTFGEVINSQPQHLHHFAILGCPNKVDPTQDGMPSEINPMALDCILPVGVWAPGSDVFGNTDLDTGILLGKGLGIQSLKLNVHYTDGVYEDEAQKILKMATDGIRAHYTPNFRPFTSISKALINVVTAPRTLTIPPGESRFFLSRTCKVNTKCKDADEKTLNIAAFLMGITGESDIDVGALLGSELSCESLQPLCNSGGEMGPFILQLCPSTCGLCEKGTDGAVNPLNPDTYRVTAIWYHAHLLGREMYTTLIRDEEQQEVTALESSTAAVAKKASTTNTVTKDLQSREFWIFDNQEIIPFDFEVVRNDTIMRGTEIKPGDKIQASCVYDSTYQDDPTRFYLSTYDEMCGASVWVTFETPASLLNGEDNAATAAVDIVTEINLMSFSCEDDAESDLYSGTLTAEEEGRNIWKDHPVDKAQGCTFVTSDFLSGAMTEETRNCDISEFEIPICDSGEELLSDKEAGASCTGGTLNEQDANAGVTAQACQDGGGTYQPYTCEGIQAWLNTQASEGKMFHLSNLDYLIDEWWKPKCCVAATAVSSAPGGRRITPIVLLAVSTTWAILAIVL